MTLKPIRTNREHAAALREIDRLWDAKPGTPDADKAEVLVMLVEAYEAENHPIDPPDPIEAILFHMGRLGLTRRDLEPMIGGSGRVSEVLAGKRALSLSMIRKLTAGLGIPADVLIQETVKNRAA